MKLKKAKRYTILVLCTIFPITSFSQNWTQIGSEINGEDAANASGESVSISADGSTVAIGAPGNSGNGISSGHVRVYQFNGSDWIQKGIDIDGHDGLIVMERIVKK